VYVELYDSGEGKDLLVGHASLDLRWADGKEEMTPVVPGQPITAKVQMYPLDAVVPAGHKLVLRITQDPPVDPLPSPIPTAFVLQYGGETKSELRLPVIQRGAADFAGAWPYGPGEK
jgi:hypothetical protein